MDYCKVAIVLLLGCSSSWPETSQGATIAPNNESMNQYNCSYYPNLDAEVGLAIEISLTELVKQEYATYAEAFLNLRDDNRKPEICFVDGIIGGGRLAGITYGRTIFVSLRDQYRRRIPLTETALVHELAHYWLSALCLRNNCDPDASHKDVLFWGYGGFVDKVNEAWSRQ